MKGIREIKSRIKSVKSTGQITHAMQLVASSKMKKAQSRAESGRAYNLLLLDLMDTLMTKKDSLDFNPRIFTKTEAKNRLIIVFSTDKGLCGPLNSNLFKIISGIEREGASYIAVGNKAARYIAATKRNLLAHFDISDNVEFNEVKIIVDYALKCMQEQGFDTLEVLYPAFINTLKQDSTLLRVAPIENLDEHIAEMKIKYKSDLDTHSEGEDKRQLLIEPSPKELFEQLPLYYIRNTIYHLALEAKASEQSARMVSMKAASDNADSLIASLSLQYNKARQEAITNEIIELSSAMVNEE